MVDRYSANGYDHGLEPDAFVLYTDYAALAAENAKLREALALMSEAYNNMGAVIDALRRQIDGDTSRETAPR